MNAEYLEDVWQRTMDIVETMDDKIGEHIEGGPPGTRKPNANEHRAWMMKQFQENAAKYPPQWYESKDGPVFGSLWVLTRQYVKGWDDEMKKFIREMTPEVSDGDPE